MGGWLFAMPFDVPKTNVQSRYDTKVFGSYFPELIKIAKQRGVLGLYAGLGPTVSCPTRERNATLPPYIYIVVLLIY
jgi:solute carrier family 25 ornithine transporter 2/15